MKLKCADSKTPSSPVSRFMGLRAQSGSQGAWVPVTYPLSLQNERRCYTVLKGKSPGLVARVGRGGVKLEDWGMGGEREKALSRERPRIEAFIRAVMQEGIH